MHLGRGGRGRVRMACEGAVRDRQGGSGGVRRGGHSKPSLELGSAARHMKRSRGQSLGALQLQRTVQLPARRQARASA